MTGRITMFRPEDIENDIVLIGALHG